MYTFTYSAAGQKAYENQSQPCSSFNRALTTAIKQGGTFMDVFNNTVLCKCGGAMYMCWLSKFCYVCCPSRVQLSEW